VAREDHGQPRAALGERRGQRQQDACAVSGASVGGRRAAVRDPREAGQDEVDDLARRAPARVRDEADAAGVELGRGIVERREGQRKAPPGVRRCRVTSRPMRFG
jgi:hypothetical protein